VNDETIATLVLSAADRAALVAWLREALEKGFESEAACVDWLCGQSAALPLAVREGLTALRSESVPDVVIVRGFPLDTFPAGPTPLSYRQPDGYEVEPADLFHGLLGVLLGEPVGFKGQQFGRLFNDIIPLGEFAGRPNHSAGFSRDFRLHTEDSFHPLPPTYFGLMCVRNHDRVPSTIAFVRTARISESDAEVLRSSDVRVRLNSAQRVAIDAAHLPRLRVLWGDIENPCFRINLANIDRDDFPSQAVYEAALRFAEAISLTMRQVTLDPGDAVWIDNLRVAHARDAYSPRLDGTDRWLKRLVVVPDLDVVEPLTYRRRILDNDRLADPNIDLPGAWHLA
jgi:L-asparagine oxygenase